MVVEHAADVLLRGVMDGRVGKSVQGETTDTRGRRRGYVY